MGSCVSLPRSPPPTATTAPELGRVATVVDLDGSVARFEGPVPVVTARDALLVASGSRHGRASPPCFLCSSDELGFDAPVRAMAPEEALQPGQLYFVLPASVLRRPLSGQDMAALAVKAARALLAVDAGLGFATSVSSLRKGGGGEEAGKLKKTARVAPLVAQSASSKEQHGII